jgi:hypothetical protein
MRTSVRLDEELLKEVKRFAAEEGTTLTAVVDQALREMLVRRKGRQNHARVPLPSFKGRGLQPGVDLNNSAALLDLMDHGDGPH